MWRPFVDRTAAVVVFAVSATFVRALELEASAVPIVMLGKLTGLVVMNVMVVIAP